MFKKIELPTGPSPKKGGKFMFTVKVFSLGAILGAGIAFSSCVYWYLKQPKQSLSKVQEWVTAHPEEADWAMKRWERFQVASKELYMKEDAIMLDRGN